MFLNIRWSNKQKIINNTKTKTKPIKKLKLCLTIETVFFNKNYKKIIYNNSFQLFALHHISPLRVHM